MNASYSADDMFSKPDPDTDNQKHIYWCHVLTGKSTTGWKGLNVPPINPKDPSERFDSVIDNMVKPSMFVIFHDTQAYPAYLITFKVKKK